MTANNEFGWIRKKTSVASFTVTCQYSSGEIGKGQVRPQSRQAKRF